MNDTTDQPVPCDFKRRPDWTLIAEHLLHQPKRALFPVAIGKLSYWQRLAYHARFRHISRVLRRQWNTKVPHHNSQILAFVDAIHSLPPSLEGCIVEAGCFKGASAAKFSIAAKKTGRQLVLFDSFEGLPENEEPHDRSILGHSIQDWFKGGEFCGSLAEVKATIAAFGHIEACNFIKGWFEDTMPHFKDRIAAAYIDVDLASSTETCLKYLYPLIVPGGVLFSQDGDFPLVIKILDDDQFWEQHVGCKKPVIEGLGTDKLLRIIKPREEEACALDK